MKKIILIALFYLFMFLTACFCPPHDSTTTYITIHSARALFYSYDENGVFPYLEEFNRDELGIGVYADSISERIVSSQWSTSLINSTYACDDNDRTIYENMIDSINIVTLFDFNENYLANSCINNILRPFYALEGTSDKINELSFTDIGFKFSEVPTLDSMQFRIAGRISENEFEIITKLVVLND